MLTAVQTSRLEPLARKPAGSLLVHEIYRSVQGESTFAGLPCVFVRLTACSARCLWCDTPHGFKVGSVYSLDQAYDKVIYVHWKSRRCGSNNGRSGSRGGSGRPRWR